MDDRLFKSAMGKFASGVTVITTETEEIHGMTANAFMSVSLDPKLVVVSVSKNATCHEKIKEAGTFAVSILSQEQEKYSMYFARQLKEEMDVAFERFEGQPIIEDSLASLVCRVHSTHETGDHTLFVGEVLNLKVQDGDPLLYFEGKYNKFAE
ncbi:flavin reductase family protein [Sinobaca sp. H24]|uniref:flavin reductase family protein n=1 Tax=Sinobaca sp. H24 TaxID=2923376 RepID=UPI00207A7B35|nr:flavin reductase family protein [Sinobaca sp. H24]